MDLGQTASPLEIAWTIVTLAMTLVAALNGWDAYDDLRLAQRNGGDGIVVMTAIGVLIIQLGLFVALCCATLLGGVAMLSLPGRDAEGGPSIGVTLSPWLLIVAALALGGVSIDVNRRRKWVIDELKDRHAP